MPYQKSPYFDTPPPESKIWRYMSIDKFMAMFSEELLYFPNIYAFNDRYEGTLSNKSLEEVYKTNLLDEENTPIKQDEVFFEEIDFLESPLGKRDKEVFLKELHSFRTLLYDFSNYLMFCNCWFIRDTESHAMWAEYGDKSPTSIAIQTTISDLIESVKSVSYDIHIGKVKYKDYKTEYIEGYEDFSSQDLNNPNNVLELFYAPIMHKRKIYEDEHEIRATISFESICKHYLDRLYTSEIPFYSDKMFREDTPFSRQYDTNLMWKIPKGVQIRTNLNTLIKTVVISHNAKEYFHKALRELMYNYWLTPEIIYSEI